MDTNHFKKKLEEEKVLLESELSDISKPNPTNPSDWDAKTEGESTERADLSTSADIHEEVEERHGTSDALEIRLLNINDALGKIEEGTYGTCEEGGEQIEEDRLEANPSAKTCKKHIK